METVNLNDPTNSSLVPATTGKARKGSAQAALFDRMFASLQTVSPTQAAPQTAIVLATAVEPAKLTGTATGTGATPLPILQLIEQQTSDAPMILPEAQAVAVELPDQAIEDDADPQIDTQAAPVIDTVQTVDPVAPEIATTPTMTVEIAEPETTPEVVTTPATTDTLTDDDATVAPPLADQQDTPITAAAAPEGAVDAPFAPEPVPVAPTSTPTIAQPVTDAEIAEADTPVEPTDAAPEAAQIDAPAVVAAPIIAAQLTRVATRSEPAQPAQVSAPPKAAQAAAMTQVAASQPRTIQPDTKPQPQAKFTADGEDSTDIQPDLPVMPHRARARATVTDTSATDLSKGVETVTQVAPATAPNAAATTATIAPLADAAPDTPGDAPAPETASVDTTDAAWVETLSAQIEANFTDTGGEIDMLLTPENLGQLRIRLEVVDGAAQVTILTETSDAARLFQQNEAKLGELLARSGLNLTDHNATADRGDKRGDQGAQAGDRDPRNAAGMADADILTPTKTKVDRGLVNLMA